MKWTLFQVDLDPTYNPHLLLQQGGTEHHEFQVLFLFCFVLSFLLLLFFFACYFLFCFFFSFLLLIFSIAFSHKLAFASQAKSLFSKGIFSKDLARNCKPIKANSFGDLAAKEVKMHCCVFLFCLASRREKKCFRTKSLTLLSLLETLGHAC